MDQSKRVASGFSSATSAGAKPEVKKSSTNHRDREQQAISLINQGKLQEAEVIYRSLVKENTKNPIVYANLAAICIMQKKFSGLVEPLKKALKIQPDFPEAHNNLGIVLKELGDIDAAIDSYNNALQLDPKYADAYNNLGNALKDKSDLDAAIDSYTNAIEHKLNFPDAHNNLGICLKEQGELAAAVACFKNALQLQPNYPEAHNNLGVALKDQGELDNAVTSYNNALTLRPNYPEALNNLGVALKTKGELDAAIASYEKAIELNPNYTEAYCNLGNAFKDLGELNAAVNSFNKALELNHNSPEAHNNLANALWEKGEIAAAIACYNKALKIRPDYAEAHNNLGIALKEQGNLDAAVDSYHKALELKHTYPEAHYNLGVALIEQGKLSIAIESFNKAIDLKPNYLEAHINLGTAFKGHGDLQSAAESYKKALKIGPNNNTIFSHYILCKKKLASWDELPSIERFGEKYLSNTSEPFDPFFYIGHQESPEMQCKNSTLFAKRFLSLHSNLNSESAVINDSKRLDNNRKLRIGYFSSNFRTHPVLHLLKGVLRNHDTSKFDIYIFDTIVNRPLNDPYLQAIEDSTLNYIHIGDNSLDICLEIVQEYKLDVAIDLMGYTDDKNVCKLFSKRIATVQINYLGYPGTTGCKHLHDCIIADKIVIPQHHEQYYEEDVVRLPDCYLCSDNTNAIADLNNLDTQKPCPLDKAGFKFCCFNNIWKITSKEFDIWMRLLKKNPGSILWLRSDLETAIQNLKLEAKARNINPDRLIFAEKTDMAEHLARHQKADLFLDTFAYNAHATALDALWAGLPVLTMQGNNFPSRVGSSILSAAELPELITTSEHEYESKAQWLVDHPDELRQLKDRLIKNRLKCSLFNTEKTTRDLEQIYRECWQETTGMISK